MPPREAVLPEELTERLSALEARVRGLTHFRGMGVVGVALAAGIGCGVLVDYLWDVGTTVRLGLLAATVVLGLTAVWCALWRPMRRRPDVAELAALVERGHPELRERLLSAVELQSSDEPEAWKGSPLMRVMLFRDTLAQTADIDFTEAVSPVRAGFWATAGVVAWLGLLAPFAFSPSGYGLLLQRFVTPWQNLARAGNLYFKVEPGDRIVARGSDITIRATVGWRSKAGELPAAVWLNWTSAPGISDSHVEPIGDSRRMELDSTGTRYVTTIPHVFDGFDYDISGGKARSPRFRVDVVDAPSLAAVKLDVQPPAYTGRPATTIDGVTGEIAVFEQSRLDFRLEFNKPVQEARLFFKSRASNRELSFKLAGDHKSATLQLSGETGGPFEFHLTDEFGLTNPEEPERILVIIGDQPPQLVLSGSNDPQELRATDVLTVTATAEDDVGIGALELHYRINGENEFDDKSRAVSARSAAAGKLESPAAKLGSPAVSFEFQWELSPLKLSEGDVLSYRVRAADERPVPGPQEVWSQPRVVKINRLAPPPGSSELGARQQDLFKTLEGIRTDVQAAEKKTAELQTAVDSAGRKNEEFTENKQLPPLAERQTALGQRLEQLAANLAEHPLFAKSAAQTEEVARNELQSAREQIQTAEQETDLARKRDFLGEAKEQLEQADQQLAEIGKRLDALAKTERDLLELNRLAEQAREMSRQLSELDRRPAPPAEQAGEKPAAEQPSEQKERQEQMASLEDQQRALAGKLGEMLGQKSESPPEKPVDGKPSGETSKPSEKNAPSEQSPGGKDVPPEIAAPVAEALRQVQEAMQQLADAQPKSGEATAKRDLAKGEPSQSNAERQQAEQGKPSSQSKDERSPDTGQKQPSPRTALAQCAQCMGQAAAALAKAAQQSQPGSKGMPQPGPPAHGAAPQDGPQADQPGSNGTGNFAFAAPDAARLDAEVQKLTGRRWGELPGHLQTEILQAAAKKPNGDYARLIKLYFKEIAQTRKPETGKPAPR